MSLRMQLYAHRGAGKQAPENTLLALRQGAAAGFKAVEFDAMPTLDGHLILHHDWQVGRTLQPRPGRVVEGQPLFERKRIIELTYSELQHFEAGSWLAPQFAGEPLPLLAEALTACAELGLEVNLEVKLDVESGLYDAARLASTAALFIAALQASPYAEGQHLVLSGFCMEGLYALRRAGYSGRLAVLFEDLPDNWATFARELQAEAVHLHYSHVTAEVVRRIHTTGRRVRVYTVNNAQRVKTLDAIGVDACFTDEMSFSAL
jgi:glycerophosphoryl diester phosphodiesterase